MYIVQCIFVWSYDKLKQYHSHFDIKVPYKTLYSMAHSYVGNCKCSKLESQLKATVDAEIRAHTLQLTQLVGCVETSVRFTTIQPTENRFQLIYIYVVPAHSIRSINIRKGTTKTIYLTAVRLQYLTIFYLASQIIFTAFYEHSKYRTSKQIQL